MKNKMEKVRWTFDGVVMFDGFTDGSKWNGFNNIWVDEENHEKASKHMLSEIIHSDDDYRVTEDWENMKPNKDGLYSYANCYTTYIVEDDRERVIIDCFTTEDGFEYFKVYLEGKMDRTPSNIMDDGIFQQADSIDEYTDDWIVVKDYR